MVETIKYQLSHLTDFSGRDARQTFWYYVLFLVVIQFLIGMIAAIPMYIDMFSSAMDGMQSGAGQADLEAQMMAGMAGGLERSAIISAIIGIATTFLFIAAFVRRLHDAGFSGWWAALPVVCQLGGIWAGFAVIDTMTDAIAAMPDNPNAMIEAQADTFAYSAISWLGYLVVIVFGVMKSKGPNQYGEEPVRF